MKGLPQISSEGQKAGSLRCFNQPPILKAGVKFATRWETPRPCREGEIRGKTADSQGGGPEWGLPAQLELSWTRSRPGGDESLCGRADRSNAAFRSVAENRNRLVQPTTCRRPADKRGPGRGKAGSDRPCHLPSRRRWPPRAARSRLLGCRQSSFLRRL